MDRKEELRFLEEAYRSPKPQLVIIYGRRRVGKTELVLQFLKNKPHAYYLADLESERSQLMKFKRSLEPIVGDESFKRAVFKNWEDVFVAFLGAWSGRIRPVIAIDEFPNLIRVNLAFSSILQRIWDLYLSRADIMLILTGSSVSLMESEALSVKSPLYGRRTGQWKISPIGPEYLREFLPYGEDDLARTYGITGGIPHYLNLFDPKLAFWENLEKLALHRGGFLYEEADFLLREELRDPSNYKTILEALAKGATRLGEVCNLTGLDKGLVSKYISVLERLEIVKGEKPFGAGPKSRRKRYKIGDPYMRFYFRYIQPNKQLIESDLGAELREEIREDYDNFMRSVLEDICSDVLPRRFRARKAGRWWSPEGDIDLIMVGRSTTMIVECKWGTAKIEALEAKMRELATKSGIHPHRYLIVARRFAGNPHFSNTLPISLKDLLDPAWRPS